MATAIKAKNHWLLIFEIHFASILMFLVCLLLHYFEVVGGYLEILWIVMSLIHLKLFFGLEIAYCVLWLCMILLGLQKFSGLGNEPHVFITK